MRFYTVIATTCLAMFSATGALSGQVVYQTNYDSLAPGQLTRSPGAAGQDGYIDNSADYPHTFSTIQSGIANPGQALLQVSLSTEGNGSQTVADRYVTPVLLVVDPVVTVSVDFYSDSSDLSLTNVYSAGVNIQQANVGNVASFGIGAGNGPSKSQSGVNVNLSEYYADATNNGPVPTTVGKDLTWDAWHHVTLVEDYAADSYVSLTVDGSTEDLSGIPLPRSFVYLTNDPPFYPTQIDRIDQEIVAGRFPDQATTDEVAWDNLTVTAVPEPTAACFFSTIGFLHLKRRPRHWLARRKSD